MMLWIGILVALACSALSTFYVSALVAFAALGRLLEDRDRADEPPGLSTFLLRDATSIIAAWVVGAILFALASMAALTDVTTRLLTPALSPFVAQVLAVVAGTALIVAAIAFWKGIAERSPHRYGRVAAALVLPIYLAIYPIRRITARALEKLYPPLTLRAGVLFTEDFKDMTENGDHSRLLDEDEREMIQRVFLLGETSVREIMVPRIDMIAVEAGSTILEVIEVMRDKLHSRVPVYRESIDNIIGFLHIKDAIFHLDRLEQIKLSELLRPAHFVPETKRADDLLSEMRARRMHLAIVVDEYGGTAGLVTLEDVIEEVVGEIQDESDAEVPLVSRLPDGSFRVDAKVDLDDFNDRLQVELPTDDSDTLGGFIYGLAGRIPVPGDHFHHGELEFVIRAVRGKRITQVVVRKDNVEPASHPGE